MLKCLLLAFALASLAFTPASAQAAPSSKVTVIFDHVLPNVPGKSMRRAGRLPTGRRLGGAYPSGVGLHLCDGARRFGHQQGQRRSEAIYTAGESFIE